MISTTGVRVPLPSVISRWAMMDFRLTDKSCIRLCRDSSGNMLMMRVNAWYELLACSVATHRWPDSAKLMAAVMAVWSRISPIIMQSGAWRRALFSAS